MHGSGSECRRLRAAGRRNSCWGTSREVVIVVAVNDVDSCDGDGDGDVDGDGLGGVSSKGVVCVSTSTVVVKLSV